MDIICEIYYLGAGGGEGGGGVLFPYLRKITIFIINSLCNLSTFFFFFVFSCY